MNEIEQLACAHQRESFDRTVCACGWMHYYCDDCGALTEECTAS